MTHLIITEHEGKVPAAGHWEWVGAGAESQQGRPAEGGSATSEGSEGTQGSMG